MCVLQKLATSQKFTRRSPLAWGLPTLRNVVCFCIPVPPPHDYQYAIEQHILEENVEKCCSKGLGSTLPREAAVFKLHTIILSSDHLHPSSVLPQKNTEIIIYNKYMETTFANISRDNYATFYFLLASTLQQPSWQTFPQDPSPFCSIIIFGQPTL